MNRMSGGAALFLCALVPLSACESPKRDFGDLPGAAMAGFDDGGSPSAGGSSGSSSDSSGALGGGAAGASASQGGADTTSGGRGGQPEPSGGEAGAAGSGGELPVTDCAPTTQRSCAEAGLLGSCALGTQTCLPDGSWGVCNVAPKPKDSCLTGNDDSCNGIANEGCGCVVGAERTCLGVQGNCASGKQTCTDGSWGICSIAAKSQDACTPGDDSNCNGKPNEGCNCTNGATQSCGAAAIGICKPGTSTCSAGAWGMCVGAITAAPRDCRSTGDNDCDGKPDNTLDSVCQCIPTKQQVCGTHAGLDGKGICKAGSQTCNAAGNNTSSSWGSCAGSVGPATRNCSSSADNDCNGTADAQDSVTCTCAPTTKQSCNGHGTLDGKGICKAGSQTCATADNGASSAWGSCSGAVGPATRNCGSSADNDCNGVADNVTDNSCQCNPSLSSSCPGGGKCNSTGSTSQCVACTANADCNNGTCSANVCKCTAAYAGTHCEFLAFQGIGVGMDANSIVNNISHDGTTVVGYTYPDADPATPEHAVRWANGTLSSIPEPANLTASFGCAAYAADASANVFGFCENSAFQYVNNTSTVTSLSPASVDGATFDVSKDGKVLVGLANLPNSGGQQAFRRASSTTTLLPKLGTDWSRALACNGDGSIVVGDEYIFYHVGWYWSSASKTVQLKETSPGAFGNYDPADVSTDGTVIVGYGGGNLAIKWSGKAFATIATTADAAYTGTNLDGSVSVGYQYVTNGTVAAIWYGNSIHQVAEFLNMPNLSGWTLTSAVAVSDDGKVVVGNGTHFGRAEGWIAHLP